MSRRLRSTGPLLFASLLTALGAHAAETTVDLSGTVPDDELRHFFVDFDVPAGIKEIQIAHDDLSADNILDWGLVDASGAFRGWGGGNEEDAVVGEQAASRSYLAGPISPGKWQIVVGKAQIKETPAKFSIQVTLRDTATLPPQTERAPYQAPAPLSQETRWYAGDFHVHSVESGDARPPLDEVATFAKGRGLDFVLLSDHNTTSQLDFYAAAQKKHSDFLFLPGVEFTTYWGHANAIGSTQYVDDKTELPGRSITGAVEQFHAQGALFSINHPTLDVGDACIGCAWTQDLPVEQMDAVEIGTGKFGILVDTAVELWDELCDQGRHLTPLGGSDDHKAGVDESALQSPIGSPTTMVHASELSVQGIIAAVRDGRTVVKLGGPDDPMIDLGSDVAALGETVTAGKAHLKATITGGQGHSVRWVKNGVEEEAVDIDADPFVLERDVTAPKSGEDRWRVEALLDGKRRTVTSHIWLSASPDSGSADEESGCGCRVAGRPGWGAGALAFLAALALAARRRRR